MARKPSNRLPKLGRHSSGQARITLNGKVYYCGAWGSLEAQKRYAELIERWEANDRQPLEPAATVPQVRKVRDLLDDYLAWIDATGRYQKHGKATSQRAVCDLALDEFAATCGAVIATKLSAVLVRQHRDVLEKRLTLTRTGINRKIRHVLVALRWARERGALGRDQWLGIAEVRPLSRHECAGRDWKRPKRAVTIEEVERVAAETSPQVARMLRVQAAVGMRPGEVCRMRWCDLSSKPIDVDGVPCTIYTVAAPKNEHHGREATVYALPPRVVAMLGTVTAPGAYVFPSPVTGRAYCAAGYWNAVARACPRAGVPTFSPHQIRHGFLTRAAARYGVLAASAAGNHANVQTTAGYLHRDRTDGYRVVVGLNTEIKTG